MNALRIGIGPRLHPALLRSDKEHMRPKLRPICRFRSIGHKGHIGFARHHRRCVMVAPSRTDAPFGGLGSGTRHAADTDG